MSRARKVRGALCAILGLVIAVAAANGQAPDPGDPARVAVFGVSSETNRVSSISAAAITWGRYQDVWQSRTSEVTSTVGVLSGGRPVGLLVQVALANPAPRDAIVLKEYPVEKFPSAVKDAKFGFSLEIVPERPVVGIQKFGTKHALVIALAFPAGSRPFFLTPDKQRAVFLEDMRATPGLLPDFKGKVTRQGPEGSGRYLIEVDSWRAGDPCGGG